MKAREIAAIRCFRCDGRLVDIDRGRIYFRVLRIVPAFVDLRAVRELAGLSMMMGDRGGAIAEALAPDPEVVKIGRQINESIAETEIYCCGECSAEIGLDDAIDRAADDPGTEKEEEED